jgi:hypothetical protein
VTSQTVNQTFDLRFWLIEMAFDAPSHIHLYYRCRDIHTADIAVTGFAIKT